MPVQKCDAAGVLELLRATELPARDPLFADVQDLPCTLHICYYIQLQLSRPGESNCRQLRHLVHPVTMKRKLLNVPLVRCNARQQQQLTGG